MERRFSRQVSGPFKACGPAGPLPSPMSAEADGPSGISMARLIVGESARERAAPRLPGKGGRERSARDDREFLEGVARTARTVTRWRGAAADIGLRSSLFRRFRRRTGKRRPQGLADPGPVPVDAGGVSLERRGTSLAGLGLALVLIGGSLCPAWAQIVGAGDAGPAREVAGVVLEQGILSVNVQDEDFGTIVRRIARQARIDVSNLEGLPDRRISTRFADLPLLEGVRRLLRVAAVPGYALITARTEEGVKIERILFLDADAVAGGGLRPAAPPRTAARRARREEDGVPGSVPADLRANPETARLLNRIVHPNERVREQAIERLARLAGDADGQRRLIEALEPFLEQLREGDPEAREEAREDIRAMLGR